MSVETIDIVSEPTGAEAPVVSNKPDHIPEKFWDANSQSINVDSLSKSYVELEKKLSASPENETPIENASDPESATNEALDVAADAGINVDELQQHYNENGSISEEHYSKLEKHGIPKEVVDEFINLRTKAVENMRQEVFAGVGGEQEFALMSQWAANNWDAKRIEAFNNVMETKDPEQWRLATEGLKASYVQAKGIRPNFVTPTTTSNTGGDAFESFQQLTEAMNDPRYSKDPAYRAKVEARLKRSNI